MAVYEFLCEKCNLTFEKMQSVKETTESFPCPGCSEKSKKIISKSAVISSKGYSGKTKADIHMGRFADWQWKHKESEDKKRYEARKKHKRMGLEMSENGEYAPPSKETVEERKEAFRLHGEYLKEAQKAKETTTTD